MASSIGLFSRGFRTDSPNPSQRRGLSSARAVALAELARELRVDPLQFAKSFFDLGFLSLQHFDLLQALNTGHAGTLSTIHANSAEQALARLAACVLQSGIELPYQAVRQQIADAIHLVLHLSRKDHRRFVQELIRVGRYNGAHDCYEPESLFSNERRCRLAGGSS